MSFTKDNVPVLLHDNTVDRTSNGTGTIGALTLEQVRALDFGSWKSADYKDEKIPTLQEFVDLCKTLGLHAYIELKTEGTTAEQVKLAYDIVKNADMTANVTWISFGYELLDEVRKLDDSARLGYVVNSVNEKVVENCRLLKTDNNQVFVDCNVNNLTDYSINWLKAAGIPVEVWTVDSEAIIAGLDKYVSGFTSNLLNAQKVLKNLTADRETVSVKVLPCDNGSATLSATEVLDGSEVTVTVNAATGYLVSSLKINGVEKIALLEGSTFKFVVDGNTTVEIAFADENDFVTVTCHVEGVSESKRIAKGEKFVYATTPIKADNGIKYYTFEGWYADAEFTQKVTDFVFDADTDLYAKFTEEEYAFALNFTDIDVDTIYGEQLLVDTGYKGAIEWRISGDEGIAVSDKGYVSATAAGTATVDVYAEGVKVATCTVTAIEGNAKIAEKFVGERTNVYKNITDGTRALLYTGTRFDSGVKITLKKQYRNLYRWSVSQVYRLPAQAAYLNDVGWNISWKTQTDSYTTTESCYPYIVIAVKDNTSGVLPKDIENKLCGMFTIELTEEDSGFISLDKFIADNSVQTEKLVGTTQQLLGGTANAKRITLAVKVKVGAGTKIRFNAHTKSYLFSVHELTSFEEDPNSATNKADSWNSTWKTQPQKLVYTVKTDCYLTLTMAVPGGKNDFTEAQLTLLDNVFDISYVAPAAEVTE